MNVGDVVKYRNPMWARDNEMGIIIERGVYVGRRDTKILWNDGDVSMTKHSKLVIVSKVSKDTL